MLLAVVALAIAAACDDREYARRLDEGIEGAPVVQTAPLSEVIGDETVAQLPEAAVGLAARRLAEQDDVAFVLRNVSSIAALHRQWDRRYLAASGAEMDVSTYRDKRMRHTNEASGGVTEAMRASEDYAAYGPVRTMAWLLAHNESSMTNGGRVYAVHDASLKDDGVGLVDQIARAFAEFAPPPHTVQDASVMRFGFRELHYGMHRDGYGNFIAQVAGVKRMVLLPPPMSDDVIPWEKNPSHPHYRQSSIWPRDALDDPVVARAAALQVTLFPGDVVFVPAFWMHYVETAPSGEPPFWLTLNQWSPPAMPRQTLDPPPPPPARCARLV